MLVQGVEIRESPDGAARLRLRAEVKLEGTGATEEWWFDVSAGLGALLSRTGNPWLALALPLAARLQEPLRLPLPVSQRLLDGAVHLMHVWRAWYPDLRPVSIDAAVAPETLPARPSRTAAFLSGGVDSLFTALRPREQVRTAERGRIDDLITVWGLDISHDRSAAVARLVQRHREVAGDLGLEFLDIGTNVRSTRWADADWGRVAHGCALAAVALILERRYDRVLVAATGGYRDLHPWGSHPLTDPLFSTETMAIVHDGAAFTRVQKSRLLGESPVAARALHVCWKSGDDTNCGACNKCYRAMLILELLGTLRHCRTLPPRIDLARASRIFCGESWDFRELTDIEKLARSEGRHDIARAAARSMRASRRLARQLRLVRRLRAHPRLGRLPWRLEQRLLRGWLL